MKVVDAIFDEFEDRFVCDRYVEESRDYAFEALVLRQFIADSLVKVLEDYADSEYSINDLINAVKEKVK